MLTTDQESPYTNKSHRGGSGDLGLNQAITQIAPTPNSHATVPTKDTTMFFSNNDLDRRSVTDRRTIEDPFFWQNLIVEQWHLDGETTNITNAGILMAMFCTGLNFVYDRANELGLIPKDFIFPSILASAENPRNASFSYHYGTNSVNIYLPFLIKSSHLPIDTVVDGVNTAGTTIFTGLVPDYWKLGGAEEMTHAIQSSAGLLPKPPYDSAGLTDIQYIAEEHEFQALKWRLNTARKLKMPQKTISNLVINLQRAFSYRRKQPKEMISEDI